MGAALYFLIWGIWAKNGKLAVTFNYLDPIFITKDSLDAQL